MARFGNLHLGMLKEKRTCQASDLMDIGLWSFREPNEHLEKREAGQSVPIQRKVC